MLNKEHETPFTGFLYHRNIISVRTLYVSFEPSSSKVFHDPSHDETSTNISEVSFIFLIE